jgi:hypothetical protein
MKASLVASLALVMLAKLTVAKEDCNGSTKYCGHTLLKISMLL